MKEDPKDITGPVLLEDAHKTLHLVTGALKSLHGVCDLLFGAADHPEVDETKVVSGDGLMVELRETLVHARLMASDCDQLASGLVSRLSGEQKETE